MKRVMSMPREIIVLLAGSLMLLTASQCWGQADPRVAYAPDIIGVERIFLVALNVPAGAPELAVSVPDSVVMFDRTPLPTTSEVRKYYFRSLTEAGDVEITFGHPDGDVVIPIVIWGYEDLLEFRELKGTQLPRRWPLGEELPELKTSRTLTTAEPPDEPKAGGGRYTDLTDDEIWDMQPDSTIPRWHWVNVTYGCPVHGTEIYQTRAYYPWGEDTTPPYSWKIKCPVGDELYPSNDFANGDMTSGEFPDDGMGGACEVGGKKYGFIAQICQAYCHKMLKVPAACAGDYISTGSIESLHKSLVGFSRLAYEYAYLATMTHHRHRNRRTQVDRLGQSLFSEGPFLGSSGFTVYCINQPGYQNSLSKAYDQVWAYVDRDPEIIPYLQGKGIPVETPEDVRRFIEQNLFAVWIQGSMDRACASNEPYQQWGMSKIAEMLNYERGADFMEALYYGIGFTPMIIFPPNTYFRDGAPYEATGGYNGMHVTAMGPIVEAIEHLRELRPELYPAERFPSLIESRRYRNIFDFSMDSVTIDRSYPCVGDDGGYTGGESDYTRLGRRTFQNGGFGAFEHAYKMFQEPKFAWALARDPKWRPSAEFPYTREEIETAADKWPDDWNDGSALLDGYGLAILRGGQGDDKRSLWMFYGRARSHVQDNIMDIGLQSHEGVILGQLGYPRNWGQWEGLWSSHHVARQFPYKNLVARAQYLADAGLAHVTEALARDHTEFGDDGLRSEPDPSYWQRRTLALVDVGPDRYYTVDLYRIAGGDDQWWSFYCQEGDFATEGVDLTAQATGTLAGPDVEYGDKAWMAANGCSEHATYGWRGVNFTFPHLYNVQRGKAAGPWTATWALQGEDAPTMRMHVLAATTADGQPMDVAITDGTAPSGGKPYEMKWLMLNATDEAPVHSQVLSVMQTFEGEPTATDVQPVALSGDDEEGFAPAACRVELGDRTDHVFISADSSVEREAEGGFTFAGRFGLWAEEAGQPVGLTLIGGTVLEKNGLGIRVDQAEYSSEIVAVDHDAHTVTMSPAPPSPDALVGRFIFIANDVRRVAYEVLGVEVVAEGVKLALANDSLIGTGRVTGAADFKVLTGTDFVLQRWDYYHGARILNEDGSADYRINEMRSKSAAMIDQHMHPEATAARLGEQFAEGSWFRVYDYGVGDKVVWPNVVSVMVRDDHRVEVTGAGTISVTLPEGRLAQAGE